MKYLSLVVLSLFLLTCSDVYAQGEPQKVYSIVKVQHEFDWYTQQYVLWEKALDKNKKQADGWLNFYTAARMAKILAPDTTVRNTWLEKMEQVIEKMKKAIPNTFEYHYIQGYHQHAYDKTNEHIFKAYEMAPDRVDTYDELLTHYELRRDAAKAAEISKKWLASGDVSPTLLLWNYNMLQSCAPNAILITAGDNDTYPSLILQQAKGVRKDITVLNSSLLLIKSYREKVFEELGIPQIKEEVHLPKQVIAHITANHGEHPLFFAMSYIRNQLEAFDDKLFNVGLALQYCEEEMDYVSLLVKNFEQKFLLDHLEQQLFVEDFPAAVIQYNKVYLPGLVTLHRHYAITNHCLKKEKVERMIQQIVAQDENYQKWVEENLKKHNSLSDCQ